MGSGEYPAVLLHLIGAKQRPSYRQLVGPLRSPPGAFANPRGDVEHVFRSRRDSEIHFTRRLACGDRPSRAIALRMLEVGTGAASSDDPLARHRPNEWRRRAIEAVTDGAQS